MPLSLTLVAITATALAAAVASGQPAVQAAAQTIPPRCSDFQLQKGSSVCIDCPGKGFARLPLHDECLDAFEILSAHVGKFQDNAKREYRTNSAVLKSVDRIREDNFNSNESSKDSIGSQLEFILGGEDMKKSVEKIVLWKRNGSCAMNVDDYEFMSYAFCMGCRGSNCFPIDKGPYVLLTCTRMYIHGFRMQRYSGNITNCDVPAEVEVYGTRAEVYRSEKNPST